jgi:hypothetical protein
MLVKTDGSLSREVKGLPVGMKFLIKLGLFMCLIESFLLFFNNYIIDGTYLMQIGL